MYKPGKWAPDPPQCVVFPSVHMLPVFIARPGRNPLFTPSSTLGGCFAFLLRKWQFWLQLSSVSQGPWPGVQDEDTGRQGSGCSLLEPQTAALSQFHGELQHCCHCCCPCWVQGDALRSKEPLQHLPSCNYPYVLQKVLFWRDCETV